MFVENRLAHSLLQTTVCDTSIDYHFITGFWSNNRPVELFRAAICPRTFLNIMKFLSHMRSKSKLNSHDEAQVQQSRSHNRFTPVTRSLSHEALVLPKDIVERILAFVCPHTKDETYATSEDSMTDGGCMLCDMRDLAQSALVSRIWSEAAATLLYVKI
jgi:hypothetical protein